MLVENQNDIVVLVMFNSSFCTSPSRETSCWILVKPGSGSSLIEVEPSNVAIVTISQLLPWRPGRQSQ
jgi:hypothetical protein